jgi:hypothetical protein
MEPWGVPRCNGVVRTIAAAVLVALGFPALADAKTCVRIGAPATAVRGQQLQVTITTLIPTSWVGGRPVGLVPASSGGATRLVLAGPRGERREVTLRRLPSRPGSARGTIRLGSRGTWRLSVLGWDYAPRACAPPKTIRVA